MNLLLSKFDNNYYLRSEYPFSMYSKTFFDDKNIFCKIIFVQGASDFPCGNWWCHGNIDWLLKREKALF